MSSHQEVRVYSELVSKHAYNVLAQARQAVQNSQEALNRAQAIRNHYRKIAHSPPNMLHQTPPEQS